MKTGIDLKSVMIGLVAGLALFALLGAASNRENTQSNGRFQVATNPGHAFVLDTQTGQVWEKFEPDTSGGTADDFNDPKIGQPSSAPKQ